MPRSSTVCVTGLALLMCAVALPAATSKLVVHFFGSPTCGECLEIKTALLEPIAKMHADSIDLRVHDIESDSGFALLTTMEDLYKVGTKSPQELYLPDTFLTGYADIMAQGKRLIERSLANPSSWNRSPLQAAPRTDPALHTQASVHWKLPALIVLLGMALAGLVAWLRHWHTHLPSTK